MKEKIGDKGRHVHLRKHMVQGRGNTLHLKVFKAKKAFTKAKKKDVYRQTKTDLSTSSSNSY